MTWTNPRTWSVGEIDTAAWMNTYVRDNQLHLFNLAIPAGTLVFFNGSVCPSGYTEETTARGRLIMGLPSGGTVAGTVGTALGDLAVRTLTTVIAHTHSASGGTSTDGGHSHTFPSGVAGGGSPLQYGDPPNAGGGTSDTGGSVHDHSVSGNSGAASVVSDTYAHPYLQLLFCRKT